MTSSQGADISSQTRQLRPATSGPTQVHQNPTWASSNLAQSSTFPSQLQGASRPHSVAELEECARQCCVDIKPFKAWLRIAENARRDAKSFHEQGNLESAFVEYEKAATVMLEKIPAHPDFRVFLNAKQRIDVSVGANDVLHSLAEIRTSIMLRYQKQDQKWRANSSPLQSQAPASNLTSHDMNMSAAASSLASASGQTIPIESTTRPPLRKPNRIPITTTSPLPPQLGTVQYPSLMSQHQVSQGYHPSLGSMFHRTSPTSNSVLLPSKQPIVPPLGVSDSVDRELKTVSFPRDCLNRFTSIASINTLRNQGACGLLLGKEKGGRYIVTTLLIPKQHATSDAFAMDEEELVIRFTEWRSLITLGWIRTHPTQSCFMSSVDLHIHSGFQRMLPESFAVVCAPNSTPNFGIFRLTDPPGLGKILECQASEAFHPHPNLPIYTDADKGHVQIGDLPLEIVDLRGHTTSGSTDGEGLIVSSSQRRVLILVPPSEDTLEVPEGSSSRYPQSEADSDVEEGEGVADAARTVAGNDDPIPESPKTPKLRPAAMPPSQPPGRRSPVSPRSKLPSVDVSNGLGLFIDTSLRPEAREDNRIPAPRNATSTQAVTNPTAGASEGLDMSYRAPEHRGQSGHSQRVDYLRILQDKFGVPRPDRGHSYSDKDENSSRNVEDGNSLENFVDAGNEGYNGRHSLKSMSKRSFLTSSTISPLSMNRRT